LVVAAGDTRVGADSVKKGQHSEHSWPVRSGQGPKSPLLGYTRFNNIRRKQMNPSTKDQIKGNLDEVKGKVKETAGKVTNNPNLEAEGKAEQTAGKVEKKVGQIEKVFEK
jgi:uncharacterized protein YjbJ (UPF0337 family)